MDIGSIVSVSANARRRKPACRPSRVYMKRLRDDLAMGSIPLVREPDGGDRRHRGYSRYRADLRRSSLVDREQANWPTRGAWAGFGRNGERHRSRRNRNPTGAATISNSPLGPLAGFVSVTEGCYGSPMPRSRYHQILDNALTFISLTRLRIRSIRFLPFFALHTLQAIRQVRKASGFQTGALLQDRDWTYWTMTAWDSHESMRQFMTTGPHKRAMPHLMNWCDEAAVAHWNQEGSALPTWKEADRRMRADGRASKVRKPSSRHANLTYREPRTSPDLTKIITRF